MRSKPDQFLMFIERAYVPGYDMGSAWYRQARAFTPREAARLAVQQAKEKGVSASRIITTTGVSTLTLMTCTSKRRKKKRIISCEIRPSFKKLL